jgi:hypothetical protein
LAGRARRNDPVAKPEEPEGRDQCTCDMHHCINARVQVWLK